MTPLTLTIIGAATVAFTSLISALRSEGKPSAQAQVALSLPLCAVALYALSSPELFFSLTGYGVETAQALKLTLQYDQPSSGLGVVESAIHLQHPASYILAVVMAVSAGLSLLSNLSLVNRQRRDQSRIIHMLGRLSAITWLLTTLAWGLTHLSAPLSSFGGESGVREMLRLSPLDAQRVSLFVIPEEGWTLYPESLEGLLLSMVSAGLLLLSSYKVFGREKAEETAAQDALTRRSLTPLFSNIGSLIALIASLWLAVTQGFSGSPTHLVVWGSAIILTSATSSQLPRAPRGAIATLCLLTLTLVAH